MRNVREKKFTVGYLAKKLRQVADYVESEDFDYEIEDKMIVNRGNTPEKMVNVEGLSREALIRLLQIFERDNLDIPELLRSTLLGYYLSTDFKERDALNKVIDLQKLVT
jgi:hypothetical protein